MLRIPGGGGGDGGVTSHPTGCERRALLGCEAFSTKTRKDSGKWVQLVSLRQGDQFYLPSPFHYQLVSPRESKHACPQDRRGCVLHAYVKGVELQISFLCRRFSIPFRMRCLLRLPRIPQHLLPSAHPRGGLPPAAQRLGQRCGEHPAESPYGPGGHVSGEHQRLDMLTAEVLPARIPGFVPQQDLSVSTSLSTRQVWRF